MLTCGSSDYTGGYLSMALYALPYLKDPDASCYLSSNIWLNACWPSLPHALAEYTGLGQLADVKEILGLELHPDTPATVDGVFRFNFEIFWSRSEPRAMSLATSKTELSKWLYHLFFKLAAPALQVMQAPGEHVIQPLTLSTWLHLCAYLVQERGYPCHWIAAVVDTVLSGTIATTAILPTHAPFLPDELSKQVTFKKWNVVPYLPELRTLITRQLGRLPFHLTTTTLPSMSEIAEYELVFIVNADYIDKRPDYPALLVFKLGSSNPLTQGVPHWSIWDENPDETVVVGNFIFVHDDWAFLKGLAKARFWLERNVMARLRADNWQAWLVRTDEWVSLFFWPMQALSALEV